MDMAFILTQAEWEFAQHQQGEAPLSLVAKGLLHFDGDAFLLSRTLQVVVEEAALAQREDLTPEAHILLGPRFCILVEPYPHQRESLRISPFQNEAALRAELRERLSVNNDAN